MSEITHGTSYGYAQHRRAGEPACESCTRARREYQRRYRETVAGYQRTRDANRASERRRAMALIWVKANRPDVWAKIVEAVG